MAQIKEINVKLIEIKWLTKSQIQELIQKYENEFKVLKENIFIYDNYNLLDDINGILNRLKEMFWTIENLE